MKPKYAITTNNGTSACLTAARSLIPKGADLLVGRTTYYEVALRLKREAEMRNWTIASFDPGDLQTVSHALDRCEDGGSIAIWLDQPSNWWLETTNLEGLSKLVRARSGILIVDISVHPLAPVLEQGADIAIVSLSKFPSNGLSMGGAILTNDDLHAEKLMRQREHDAAALSAESAFAISQQMVSFEDRFNSIGNKTAHLAEFCSGLPGVHAVRYPTAASLGTAHGGGVITLEVAPGYGERAEEIIAQNFHREEFPFVLACTFGAAQTIFEHFHPRGAANDEVVGSLVKPLPPNFCRIGIGGESLENLRDALVLVLPERDEEWP